MYTIEHYSDSMVRGKFDYLSSEHGKIVIDPNYYDANEFKRGDVIYFKTPSFKYDKNPDLIPNKENIARVVALAGETIEIKKGQVYINNRKLDTFYGKALSRGLNEKQYFSNLNRPGSYVCDKECQKEWKQYFNMNAEKIEVPEGSLYVMGDTWWRSVDSQIFGPLAVGNVIGKVLGYEKNDD